MFAGVDLHKHTITIVVVDAARKPAKRFVKLVEPHVTRRMQTKERQTSPDHALPEYLQDVPPEPRARSSQPNSVHSSWYTITSGGQPRARCHHWTSGPKSEGQTRTPKW